MQVTAEIVKELREKTSTGVMACRNALLETGGDIDKACELLYERGLVKARQRSGRNTLEGLIESYVHAGGHIGVLVEVRCETDFVARTDEFKKLAHELALQVAATAPHYLSQEEIPDGKNLDPGEVCLLHQSSIKDESKTIQDLIDEAVAKTGEKIEVRRFVRFEVGLE